MKCHRLGCDNPAVQNVRDRNKVVLIFCLQCFRYLVDAQVINKDTGEVMINS